MILPHQFPIGQFVKFRDNAVVFSRRYIRHLDTLSVIIGQFERGFLVNNI